MSYIAVILSERRFTVERQEYFRSTQKHYLNQ